ncbi:probable dehydrogenases with different specificities (related to short-chain alcohol dehydrogenases) [Phialocephala subalpina]|uniref:Probable dehydrogenases with different specificities (Related to short-chain alcohol dehydrogenases) n=1 Tax=Phialocephala subalpina TaxID=576137 RepID=A0A1L7X556_9HELO|nr:probable dehydrogenases with different specificities (related to short-chain alcohol dehydrogenases) [Phialocephala subalpina]
MPYSLQGRNVLVTGGSRGLGALICEKFATEGCNIAVNYVSNFDASTKVAEKLQQNFGVKTCVVEGDAGIAEDNSRLVRETIEKLGGLDIIVANAGWTRMTKHGDIYDMSYDEWNKCWAINVMSHLQLMQEVVPIFKANPDGGVYLITSSIAGISSMGSSVAYSVTKAAGLQLMKNLAFSQGPKIRVNAVLPGLLLTEWGQKFPEQLIQGLNSRATLKHETYLDDCADAFISLAKNNSMTGQQIIVDSGLIMGSLPPPGTLPTL